MESPRWAAARFIIISAGGILPFGEIPFDKCSLVGLSMWTVAPQQKNCNQRENSHMSKLYKLIFGLLVLSALLLSGCTQNGKGEAPENSPEPESVSEAPAKPSAPPVTFEGTDLEGTSVSSEIFSLVKAHDGQCVGHLLQSLFTRDAGAWRAGGRI